MPQDGENLCLPGTVLTTEKEMLVFSPEFPVDRENGTASTLSKREKRRDEVVIVSIIDKPHRDLEEEEAISILMGSTPVLKYKVFTKASRTEE